MTDEHQMWTDKYRPTSFNQIQGNNAAIGRLKDWAETFPDDRTPRLLVGPQGTGKTTTVEVIADWLDLQLVELNASNLRESDDIADMAGVIRNRGADGECRVVHLDEADSWHHNTDKQPLYDALDSPQNIVFLSVNNKWDTPSAIVSRCEMEKFKLQSRSIKAKLKDLADREGLDLSQQMLDDLSQRDDLRSAINDLQVYGDLNMVPPDQRRFEVDEMDMIDAVMTGTPDLGGDRPRDGIRPGEALLWLDENVSADYRGLELAWAYEALARADRALMRDAEFAQAIVESVANLRISEPYYDDEISYKDKSFPEWFRHRQPNATGGSDEAALYRELSNYEDGTVGLTESFVEFRQRVLPQLQALDHDEKCALILAERLSPDAYAALDVTRTQYEAWVEEEAPSGGDGLSRTEDAAAW